MEKIGIICEYNPFHNGHIYHIEKIKKEYPDSIIILCLNGYFLERGEVSILSKEDKTKIALEYGVNIVLELPAIYGTQSADIFAYNSVKILNYLGVSKIIFGSEANDTSKLYEFAKTMVYSENTEEIKKYLDEGYNYPTALAKSLNTDFVFNPNDLLGISYIKATLQINPNIICEAIQRTNSFHDNKLDDTIVSASNIRQKLKDNQNIDKYLPDNAKSKIKTINYDLLFNLIKLEVLNNDITDILDVKEGIENKLKKVILSVNDYASLVEELKSKRYTYNRINRMLIHILLHITNEDATICEEYVRILGFDLVGKDYLNSIKKDIPEFNKYSSLYLFEKKASIIYDMLTSSNTLSFEQSCKPIKKEI